MHLLCPHCKNAIELVKVASRDEILCPSCGSSFRLEGDATTGYKPMDGKKLGRFELLDTLGVGAFGTVYKARDPELDRTVAIKVPRSGNLAGPEELDRFLREARSVAQLRHPSIVAVHEVSQSDGVPYLVSELVEGITLADLLSARRPPPREAAELIASIADALQYAHDQGVVHRDVKPSNIMLESGVRNQGSGVRNQDKGPSKERRGSSLTTDYGLLTPRLMDFGLAKRDAGEITMTVDGQVLGTPAYMSPEQAKGEAHKVDARGDVYSLGVILYQMLTGELPFRGTTRMLLHQVLHDEPRSPRSLNDRIPRDLETICLKAMAKEPGRRYATAQAFAEDLRRWLKREPIQARPVGRVEKAWRWGRRNPAVAGLTSALAVVIVAGFAGMFWQWRAALQEKEQKETARREADERAGKEADARRAEQEARRQEDFARKQTQLMLARTKLLRFFAAKSGLARDHRSDMLVPIFDFDSVTGKERLAGYVPGGSQEPHPSMTHDLRGHSFEVSCLAFSPDGKRLASGGLDRQVKVWNLQAKSAADLTGHVEAILAVEFDSTGEKLVSVSRDGTLLTWARRTDNRGDQWAREKTLELTRQRRSLTAATFARDGQTVAVSTTDHDIHVWDVNSGREAVVLRGHSGIISSMCFNFDGTRLVSASGLAGKDGQLVVWDIPSGNPIVSQETHERPITTVAISPNGHMVACGSFDGMTRLIEVATGKERYAMPNDGACITSLAFGPDNQLLASATDDGLGLIWDAVSGKVKLGPGLIEHENLVTSMAFSRDGKLLASGSVDRSVRIRRPIGAFRSTKASMN